VNRNKITFVLVLLLGSLAILLPTFLPDYTPDHYPFGKIKLGLDLRGGSYLILGVKTDEAVKSSLTTSAIGIRSELRDKKVGLLRTKAIGSDGIEISLLSASGVEEVKEFMKSDYPDFSYQDQVGSGEEVVLRFSISDKVKTDIKKNSVQQAIETIRNRVDQYGVAEPTIQRSGEDRLMVQLPEITNIEEVKKTLGSVAKLEFRIVADEKTGTKKTISLPLKAGGTLSLEDEVVMTGDSIENATVEISPQTNEVQVSLKLNSQGKKTFSEITSSNTERSLAIILDGRVQSYPNIREPINDGRAQISGNFTKQEGKNLSIVLKSGALPASLTFEEERTVGASLGADSIKKGVQACLIGSIIVALFMMVYYKKAGVLSVFCLLLNLILLLAFLSLLGGTLTLPGLAGFALTVGMAVDANVIIYERIKEELRSGASISTAISAGFDRAHVTIVDSNLTTLLSGIVLYLFGTGPIKGFAVTLSLGILTSMFSALYVCKLGFDVLTLSKRDKSLSI